MVRILVHYTDDNHLRHIAFVRNFAELRFIQYRFEEVTFEIC